VVLNRNSQIIYKTKSSGKKQEIDLTGEAFIKVNHSADTTLIVKAEETFIRDIGTSFNVKAYPDNNYIEVYVETGEVAFYSQDQKGLILTKGERGIYEKTSKNFRKVVAETPNIIAYSTKLLIFRNTKLSDVVNELNNVYHETIELSDPSIASCSITVTFDNESIVSIMDIIAETIGLQLIKTETGFLLKGDNCINR
jgi:ferric-dicitrate binding protein FerR (iron transport regulator)